MPSGYLRPKDRSKEKINRAQGESLVWREWESLSKRSLMSSDHDSKGSFCLLVCIRMTQYTKQNTHTTTGREKKVKKSRRGYHDVYEPHNTTPSTHHDSNYPMAQGSWGQRNPKTLGPNQALPTNTLVLASLDLRARRGDRCGLQLLRCGKGGKGERRPGRCCRGVAGKRKGRLRLCSLGCCPARG